jgi:hypothetical protein
MQLDLYREPSTEKSTSGKLFIDGFRQCFTLELPVRENREDIDAIVAGRYQIRLTESPHLGYVTPELLNVPGRKDIRMHVACYPEDILGCIGVGKIRRPDCVLQSRIAFDELMAQLWPFYRQHVEIWIEIHDAAAPVAASTEAAS